MHWPKKRIETHMFQYFEAWEEETSQTIISLVLLEIVRNPGAGFHLGSGKWQWATHHFYPFCRTYAGEYPVQASLEMFGGCEVPSFWCTPGSCFITLQHHRGFR